MTSFESWLLPEASGATPWRLQHCNEVAYLYVHDSYRGYYARLHQLLETIDSAALAGASEVFLIGMFFQLDTLELVAGTNAVDALTRVANLGAKVRILYSDYCAGEAALAAAGVDLVKDEQGHFHQKAAYLRIADVSYLFAGGMDIGHDRRDLWFDTQVELQGRVAELGLMTFTERWESAKNNKTLTSPAFPRLNGNPNTFVQFVRRYPDTPRPANPRTYAADSSYGELLVKSMNEAEHWIYIEEQYFCETTIGPNLDAALIAALKRNVRVVVVTSWLDKIEPYPQGVRPPLLAKLRAAFTDSAKREDNLTLLQIKRPATTSFDYVHSKTWIFDDKLVVVGSANYWDVSFRDEPCDNEFGVAIASTQSTSSFPGVPFGRALRVQLWNRILSTLGQTPITKNASATFIDERKVLRAGLEPVP